MNELLGSDTGTAAIQAGTGAVLFVRNNPASTGESSPDECRSYFEKKGYQIVGRYLVSKCSVELNADVERVLQEKRDGTLTFAIMAANTITDISCSETAYNALREQCREAGIIIETLKEGLVSETELCHEHAVARIRFYDAKIKLIKASSASRISVNRSKSCPLGRPPIGYRYGRTPEGYPNLDPDPEMSPSILGLFDSAAKGETLTDLTIRALNCGLRAPSKLALSTSQVLKLLRNPTYAGMLHEKDAQGNYLRGNFEAIVSLELFLKVQAVLDERAGSQPRRSQEPSQ